MFLIVGTGRSGTRWIAEALTAMGIPTGHEAVFAFDRVRAWRDLAGDCSWMALPRLDRGHPRPESVVHVTRDPCRVIASRFEIGLLPEVDHPVLEPWRPDLCDPDALGVSERFEWACELWRSLVDVAEEHSDLTLRIEDIPRWEVGRKLVDHIGYPEVENLSAFWTWPTDVNHQAPYHLERWRVPGGAFPWRILPRSVTERAIALGYSDPYAESEAMDLIAERLCG